MIIRRCVPYIYACMDNNSFAGTDNIISKIKSIICNGNIFTIAFAGIQPILMNDYIFIRNILHFYKHRKSIIVFIPSPKGMA